MPYAEVHLDGNVHFIGTQGVGKSTLLRAILFFYNADKEKLGIRKQGQRNFDDFYLPTATSYIVYQVERDDERAFSIITFRNAGRAAFRFVDAPFNTEWIIDPDGVISNDHAAVRQRIAKDGYDSSRIIDNYSAYRDILYGNSHASISKDLRKYALLESAKYQNIPRIIQNVFLNERVDADFIKDTIIKSLSEDSESKIPLRDFRSKLADFDQDYNDIMLWSKLDKKGNNETLHKANTMIEISHGIRLKDSLLLENGSFLAFAIEKTRNQLPVWRQQLEDTHQNLTAKSQSLAEAEKQYEEEKSKLDRELGALNHLIKECRELRDKYAKSQIGKVLELDKQEGALQKQQKRLSDQIVQIKAQYSSITQRFASLIDSALIAHKEYQLEQQHQQMQNDREFTEFDKQLIEARDKDMQEIKDRFSEKIEECKNNLEYTQDSIHQLRLSLVKAQFAKPFAEEIDQLREAITNSENAIADEENVIKAKETAVEVAIKDGELELIKVDDEFRPKFFDLENEQEMLLKQINAEKELLARVEGSLCQWLENNVPEWRNNIGKIAAEDKVLYNTTLCPSLVSVGQSSLFGVDIDLSSLESTVRTPQEINSNLENLNSQLSLLLESRDKLQLKKDNRKEEIKNSRSRKLKALGEEKLQAIQRKAVAQQNLKLIKLQIDDWAQRQKEEVEKEISRINDNINELLNTQNCQKQELDRLQAEQNHGLEKVSKQYEARKRAEKKKLQTANSEIDALIKAHRATTDAKITEYKKAESNEMGNAGADIKIINSLESELMLIDSSLRQIADNKPLIYNYLKDKAEKLDQEDSFKKKKAKLEASISSLKDRRQKQKEKLLAAIEKLRNTEQGLEGKINKGRTGLDNAANFMASDLFPTDCRELRPLSTAMECDEIVGKMRDLISEKFEAEKKMQQAVIEFKRPFSLKNVFKFPTQFETQADYQAYVDSVEDFIVNDKIEQFQLLTSNVYSGIISQISYEFGNILTQESSIKKILNEVKYDFAQKTFAGVIRALDLELRRSEDPLINTLQRIHDFNEEHPFEMGQNNLFTTIDNEQVNRQAVGHLHRLMEELNKHPEKDELLLSDIFSLRFKIDENDNSTGWQENIKMVGSDGTDILVKAILNILLINVFKTRATKKSADFIIHCMMDEIGKLADENIQGILDFANSRNIYIVNSSPKSHRPLSYRHLYLLTKDSDANTIVHQILSTRQAALNETQTNS